MSIGENIKKIRLQKGLTQKQLGELCGMADSAIRRYENGRANPKIETRQKIATALGVSLAELLYSDTGNPDYDTLISQCQELFGNRAVIEAKYKLLFEILRLSGFIIEFHGCLEVRDLQPYDEEKKGFFIDGEVLPHCTYGTELCANCLERENTYYKITYNGKSVKVPCLFLYSQIESSFNAIQNIFTNLVDDGANDDDFFITLQKKQDEMINKIPPEYLENL